MPNESLDDVVWHACPTHGRVLQASRLVLIEHGRPRGQTQHCGELCAPEGTSPTEHRRAYKERARARVAMRNIRSRKPLPQADLGSEEAPQIEGAV